MNGMFRAWILCLLVTACLGSADGCIKQQLKQAPVAGSPWLSVCLVRTDLGLEDGSFVREADTVLTELDQQGKISYSPVGEVPQPLKQEGSTGEIGLPVASPMAGEDARQPGTMTMEAAEALLGTVQPCDLLILSSAYLLPAALRRHAAGTLQAGAVLLLDEAGYTAPQAAPVPVYRFRYDIKEAAFLCGVAAAASSNNGMSVLLASSADPQAREFLQAARAGAYYWTTGAQVRTLLIPAAPDGVITPETFSIEFQKVMARPPDTFRQSCDHFVVALGRATPTVMYALTQQPYKGYVAGAYADFRQVRPARVIGCAEKHPGVLLKRLFETSAAGAADTTPLLKQGLPGLKLALPDGALKLGLADSAASLPGYELYKRYNQDGDDIEEAVQTTLGRLLDGEISVAEEIARLEE